MSPKDPKHERDDELGYDLIGDVHGCFDALEKLLARLGYTRVGGVYSHSSRKAIFVGDLIDRGPGVRQTLRLVKAMVEAGHAQMVMGNHEYNALCYSTLKDGEEGVYLRKHNARHALMLQETLDQFAAHPQEWQEYIAWFADLPLFLEFEHFRVVHACWDEALIASHRQKKGFHERCCAEPEFLQASADFSSQAHALVDRLTRGVSIALPDGESIMGRDGLERRFFRAKFWQNQLTGDSNPSYETLRYQPDPLPGHIAQRPLPRSLLDNHPCYATDEKMLFIGHYWQSGLPQRITPNIACLDYSAVSKGKLVAYSLDAETQIDNDKFTWVAC